MAYRSSMCALALAVGFGLIACSGCSRNAQFSKEELQEMKQIREGNRTEMPAEGRKMMEDIAAGRMKPGPPPPDVGQPGPKLQPNPPSGPPSGSPGGQR